MQAGIVGLPGCGKTTVFRALTGLGTGSASGSKGRPARGVVKVPDARLDDLASRYGPKKVTHAELVFTDLPGPGPGEKQGRSIAPSFVGDMRAMDLLVHVVRQFESPALGPPDPAGDLGSLREEMILRDLEVVDRRLARLGKGEQQAFHGEREILDVIQEALSSAGTVRGLHIAADAMARLSGFAFLTEKPEIVVVNSDDALAGTPLPGEILAEARKEARAVMGLCARLETELAELEPGEREPFMREMGIEAAGTEVFIREVYSALGLISFFTTEGPELRAWTVRSGTTAVRAAGKIHTDMERGFIRADVIPYEALVEAGEEAALRRAGRLRQEGKGYVVEDGDILTIKFNV
jgi:GTP-binding protein YchF